MADAVLLFRTQFRQSLSRFRRKEYRIVAKAPNAGRLFRDASLQFSSHEILTTVRRHEGEHAHEPSRSPLPRNPFQYRQQLRDVVLKTALLASKAGGMDSRTAIESFHFESR